MEKLADISEPQVPPNENWIYWSFSSFGRSEYLSSFSYWSAGPPLVHV